jgi:phosphohistidine phosphatase
MSCHLLLVRHAPALPASPAGDAERPLTALGLDVAAALGRGLARLLPPGAPLLTSPARRCRQTVDAMAAALARAHGLPPPVAVRRELALDAPAAALRELARAAAPGTVLVGHQPGLTGLAAGLIAPAAVPFGLPPGSVLGLSPDDPAGRRPWRLELAATAEDVEALSGP